MSKKDKKIELYINQTKYKQIRIEGKDTMWKNVPLVEDGVTASGLHIIDGHPERNHYDFFEGSNPTGRKEPTNENLGSILINPEKGLFAVPSGKLIVLTGKNGKTTFVSYDYYLSNKDNYEVVLSNKNNFPRVLRIKEVG